MLSESRWYYMTLTTTAGHAARHVTKRGPKTRKHDCGARITSAQGLHSQTDSHAACYWQVLQLRAPEGLSAHPPRHHASAEGV